MNPHLKLGILFWVALFVSPLWGAQVEGVIFADQAKVDQETLTLNGVGLRTATIFKVKVYAAALYLKAKTTEPKAVLDAPYPKQIQMEFLREVDGPDIAKAWDKSFDSNCEENCEEGKASLEKLKALMATVKKGDRMTYVFRESGVEVRFNDIKKGEVSGRGFPKSLLSTWIGKNPPTETLKEGLLGKN